MKKFNKHCRRRLSIKSSRRLKGVGLKSQKKKSQKKMLVFCWTSSFESLLQKAIYKIVFYSLLKLHIELHVTKSSLDVAISVADIKLRVSLILV
ncbi:hypothetical protein YC2023_058286 [Brassica napus]